MNPKPMNPELQHIDERITTLITKGDNLKYQLNEITAQVKDLTRKRRQIVKLYDKISKVANGKVE